MAITDKKKGVWGLDQVYNKKMQGGIWRVDHASPLLFVWGRNNESNSNGDLGLNDGTHRSSPTQLPGTTWNLFNSSTYGGNTIIGRTDGTLWMWGLNNEGQLGQNSVTGGYSGPSSPVQLPGTTWTFGTGAGMATKTDGTMWAWGYNSRGVLGQNSRQDRSSPVQIPGTNWATGRRKFTRGYETITAIKTDGTLWSWGSNSYGQLGLNQASGQLSRASSPVQVGGGTDWDIVVQQPDSTWASGAIKTDGTLWVWGRGSSPGSKGGALGQNNLTARSSPVQIPGTTWVNATFGFHNAMATKTDGTLWSWGYNNNGELGQNDRTQRSSPVQIPGTNWGTESYHFTAQKGWMAALKTDGTLWGWGSNYYGQLDNNNITYRSSPTQIPGLYDQIGGIGQGILARQTAQD